MTEAATGGGTETDEVAQHVLDEDEDEVRDDVWSPVTEVSRGQVLIQHKMLSHTKEQTETNVTLSQGLMNRKLTA